jgi:hypothetical protein
VTVVRPRSARSGSSVVAGRPSPILPLFCPPDPLIASQIARAPRPSRRPLAPRCYRDATGPHPALRAAARHVGLGPLDGTRASRPVSRLGSIMRASCLPADPKSGTSALRAGPSACHSRSARVLPPTRRQPHPRPLGSPQHEVRDASRSRSWIADPCAPIRLRAACPAVLNEDLAGRLSCLDSNRRIDP